MSARYEIMNKNGFNKTSNGGYLPTGLPGGFFVYEAGEGEKILYAEDNIIKLYGCSDFEDFLEYTDGSFKGMVYEEDLQKVEDLITVQTAYGDMRHDYVRYRIVTKQGVIRYVEDFGHLLHSAKGKSFFYVYIVDVDRNAYFNHNRNSMAEAEILSANRDIDTLTGLYNMSFFYQKVQTLISSKEGRRRDYSIIHFDIPNFKLYNERLGFRMGDELLCYLASSLQSVFKKGVIARFSDDHFVVCEAGTRDEIVEKVKDIYIKMLRTEDVNKKARVKAGIYCFENKNTEVGLACDHARLACNSIKQRHDVFYCIYDERMRDRLRKQQYVVDRIDEAIEGGYIKVFYQPVIRISTKEICGYEALVRWIDPEIGMIMPGDFVDTLEQYHLIHLIDQYMVRQVCKDYRDFLNRGMPLVPVSINISRLDFELCDICAIIEETRAAYDVPRNMLDIEITESALNDNVGHIHSECDRMKELGYHIWLDDFGSGYSSLNTIADYSFDVLKLDMVFLRSFDRNPKTGPLMSVIVDGVRGMGFSPLCEGVETEEQYEFLKKIGCEYAQGYYFGKPMPMEESRTHTQKNGLKWENREEAKGKAAPIQP
ncbi:MAG: GGDEF and EAL domain-containing protein [Lachnospiraceae bacterium]|nr:GGDEF and EAL domain-containing protein [Lachnospiraceae bacterium]